MLAAVYIPSQRQSRVRKCPCPVQVTLYVMLVGAYPFEDPRDPKNFRKTIQVDTLFHCLPLSRAPRTAKSQLFFCMLPFDLLSFFGVSTSRGRFASPYHPLRSGGLTDPCPQLGINSWIGTRMQNLIVHSLETANAAHHGGSFCHPCWPASKLRLLGFAEPDLHCAA